MPILEAICKYGENINTDKRKKRGGKTFGEELGYSSGLRELEAGSGFCLKLSFHWGNSLPVEK